MESRGVARRSQVVTRSQWSIYDDGVSAITAAGQQRGGNDEES